MICAKCGNEDPDLGWYPKNNVFVDFGDCWLCWKCAHYWQKKRICAMCHNRSWGVMRLLPDIDIYGIGYTNCCLCERCFAEFDIN